MSAEAVSEDDVFKRVCRLAVFARSVLHFSFDDLEKLDPSFTVIARTCELLAAILKEASHNGTEHAEYVMHRMRDIATAIVDRDNESLKDIMCMLDDFFEKHDVRPHLS